VRFNLFFAWLGIRWHIHASKLTAVLFEHLPLLTPLEQINIKLDPLHTVHNLFLCLLYSDVFTQFLIIELESYYFAFQVREESQQVQSLSLILDEALIT
jgi:hypothetical protein